MGALVQNFKKLFLYVICGVTCVLYMTVTWVPEVKLMCPNVYRSICNPLSCFSPPSFDFFFFFFGGGSLQGRELNTFKYICKNGTVCTEIVFCLLKVSRWGPIFVFLFQNLDDLDALSRF